MIAGDIYTEAYLPHLKAVADRYDILADVEAVPSIQDWCQARNITEERPFRAVRTLRNHATGRYLILLACRITDEMVASIEGGLYAREFFSEASALSDVDSFMVHLILHEIAHALDNTRTEDECDRWAFGELSYHLPLNEDQ